MQSTVKAVATEYSRSTTICLDMEVLWGDLLVVKSMLSMLNVRDIGDGAMVSHCLHAGKQPNYLSELLHAIARAKKRKSGVRVVLLTEMGEGGSWWNCACNCVEIWAGTGVVIDAVCVKARNLKWQRTRHVVGVSPNIMEKAAINGLGVIESDKEARCIYRSYHTTEVGKIERRGIAALAKSKLSKLLHGCVDFAMANNAKKRNKKQTDAVYDIKFLVEKGMIC